MSSEWIKSPKSGVYYREHKNRKHGIKKDRYYAIRHRVNGKVKNEVLGWASEGWSEQEASEYLSELKKNKRLGEGATSIAEKRELAKKEEKEKKKSERIKLTEIFKIYLDSQKSDKDKGTQRNEIGHFKNWIFPTFGNCILDEVTPILIEKLKEKMLKAEKAKSTISGTMCTISQMINFAKNRDLYSGDNPVIPFFIVKYP